MLVFSRLKDSAIIIGSDIVIKPVWINKHTVDVVIETYPGVRVRRVAVPRIGDQLLFDPASCSSLPFRPSPVPGLFSFEKDDVIQVGDDIFILIAGIKNGRKVRFAIHAPIHVPVHRWETFIDIMNERNRELSVYA